MQRTNSRSLQNEQQRAENNRKEQEKRDIEKKRMEESLAYYKKLGETYAKQFSHYSWTKVGEEQDETEETNNSDEIHTTNDLVDIDTFQTLKKIENVEKERDAAIIQIAQQKAKIAELISLLQSKTETINQIQSQFEDQLYTIRKLNHYLQLMTEDKNKLSKENNQLSLETRTANNTVINLSKERDNLNNECKKLRQQINQLNNMLKVDQKNQSTDQRPPASLTLFQTRLVKKTFTFKDPNTMTWDERAKQIQTIFLGSQIPDRFKCPISREMMVDPVITSTGQTYDRTSIQPWLAKGNYKCPNTGQTITPDLFDNCYARKEIYDFIEAIEVKAKKILAAQIKQQGNPQEQVSTPSSEGQNKIEPPSEIKKIM